MTADFAARSSTPARTAGSGSVRCGGAVSSAEAGSNSDEPSVASVPAAFPTAAGAISDACSSSCCCDERLGAEATVETTSSSASVERGSCSSALDSAGSATGSPKIAAIAASRSLSLAPSVPARAGRVESPSELARSAVAQSGVAALASAALAVSACSSTVAAALCGAVLACGAVLNRADGARDTGLGRTPSRAAAGFALAAMMAAVDERLEMRRVARAVAGRRTIPRGWCSAGADERGRSGINADVHR